MKFKSTTRNWAMAISAVAVLLFVNAGIAEAGRLWLSVPPITVDYEIVTTKVAPLEMPKITPSPTPKPAPTISPLISPIR
jgi:hypothetical protein